MPAIAVSAGDLHSLALRVDGTVWAWGAYTFGQLGDGTTTDRHTPGQVIGLTAVIAIAGGVSHNLALRADGTVWAWGANDRGQLGNASNVDSPLPALVLAAFGDLGSVKAVAAGFKPPGTPRGWQRHCLGSQQRRSTGGRVGPGPIARSQGTLGARLPIRPSMG